MNQTFSMIYSDKSKNPHPIRLKHDVSSMYERNKACCHTHVTELQVTITNQVLKRVMRKTLYHLIARVDGLFFTIIQSKSKKVDW